MDTKKPTEEDVNIITHQLKRHNITRPVKILRKCRWGYPMVSLAGCAHRKTYHDPNTTVKQQKKSSTFFHRAREQKKHNGDDSKDDEPITNERPIKKQKLDDKGRFKAIQIDDNEEEEGEGEKKTFVPVPGTMVWLTCPKVKMAIDKVERRGTLNVLREKYQKAPKELHQAHDAFATFLRKEMNDDQLFVQWKSANQVLDPSKVDAIEPQRFGNAGQRVKQSLKCLHAHIADFLGGCHDDKPAQRGWDIANTLDQQGDLQDIEDLCDQPLQPITEDYLSTLDCSEGCVKCHAFSKTTPFKKPKK